MSDEGYSKPKLAINRVYTKRGDKGETSLVGGQRLPKDALRIEVYGTVDELNSLLGLALVSARDARDSCPALDPLCDIIRRVQHELFNLGSLLATLPEDVHEKQPQVTQTDVARLEGEIDQMNGELPALRSFVLPGGSRLSVELHVCRAVCRRAERLCVSLRREEPTTATDTVAYLNRLSDALFVWSRWVDIKQSREESLWDPNVGTGSPHSTS